MTHVTVVPVPRTARRNTVLNALTNADLATLLPQMTERPLQLGDVLYQAGAAIPDVLFPLVGVVSLTSEMDGEQIEVATTGWEGVVGLPVFLGAGTPTETGTVQVAGTALTMTADAFRAAVARIDGPLQLVMQRYAQVMFTQLARNTACNRIHQVSQRAARWLLMTADRMDSDTFNLTQDFLARMLAVRRPSVNAVAQTLSAEGAITYTRGTITVLDRDRLHANACTCYDVLRDATAQAFPKRRPEPAR